ncbi:hypothetical protein FHR71_001198 [Methylobacterium sp. RAS18]|nr:hypothetical protein [Methylobacterium sp. RAS18]
MSHFSVLVVTTEEPTNDVLSRILMPWHEFECTGLDNEFVQSIDQTADKRAEYEAETKTRLRSPDGELFSPYENRFYRDPTEEEAKAIGPLGGSGWSGSFSYSSRDWGDGRGHRSKVKFVPEGFTEVEVPAREIQSFRAWVEEYTGRPVVPFNETPNKEEHKFGCILLTADGDVYKVIDRTNPNKKWDWWVLGGRWSGMLAPAYDPHKDPENFETCWLCAGTGVRTDGRSGAGCNGCDGTGRSLKHAPKWRQVGNSAQIASLSIENIRATGGERAAANYDRRHAIIASRPIPDFDALAEQHGHEAGRKLYWADPVMIDLQKAGETWLDREDMRLLRGSREAAIEAGRLDALATLAVVKDGQWHERGEMGWFGVVHGEQDRDVWRREVNSMIDSLPPEAWVSIVDCHI